MTQWALLRADTEPHGQILQDLGGSGGVGLTLKSKLVAVKCGDMAGLWSFRQPIPCCMQRAVAGF